MIFKCEKCDKVYDDFDHWTYCPHDRFGMSPDVKAMQDRGELRQDSGPEGDPRFPKYGEELDGIDGYSA
jgi:hypothetical protein